LCPADDATRQLKTRNFLTIRKIRFFAVRRDPISAQENLVSTGVDRVRLAGVWLASSCWTIDSAALINPAEVNAASAAGAAPLNECHAPP
jgi:hypothetical protein